MAQIFNAKQLTFKLREMPIPDYTWHTSPQLSQMVNSQHLHFNVRSLDPGKYSYPYHFHRNSEELFVILAGKATLRTPEGLKELGEGDIVFFALGPEGAHQLYNHTQEPCCYLDLGTKAGLDVCEYPDSGKINVAGREIYRTQDQVDYFDGESEVNPIWKSVKE